MNGHPSRASPRTNAAQRNQRDVWGRGGSREAPGIRKHGAGMCPLRLWLPPTRVAQMGKRLRAGEGKTETRKLWAGGLPGCTGAIPHSTAPGWTAQLLAHTPSMTTPSWALGVNQVYAGSICSSGIMGVIHISSIHPSKRFSHFPNVKLLSTSMAIAEAYVKCGSCRARQLGSSYAE